MAYIKNIAADESNNLPISEIPGCVYKDNIVYLITKKYKNDIELYNNVFDAISAMKYILRFYDIFDITFSKSEFSISWDRVEEAYEDIFDGEEIIICVSE